MKGFSSMLALFLAYYGFLLIIGVHPSTALMCVGVVAVASLVLFVAERCVR